MSSASGTLSRAKRERPESPGIPASAFASLGLHPLLLRAVRDAGYDVPTPIQEQAIPAALEGRDVLGCACTGTGKTAAFVLPVLQHLLSTRVPRREPGRVRALVLAPTRELASQIADSIGSYSRGTGVQHTAIFGGVSQTRQVRELRTGVDMLVATPGRLIDLVDQNLVRIDELEILVIDEFDRMLDQGFLPAIQRILRGVPIGRQTLLFSATVPREIESIVKHIVRDPVRVDVARLSSTPDLIDQSVYFIENAKKRAALEQLLRAQTMARTLVFTRTKHGADRVAAYLIKAGIEAGAIHGNKSQNTRERTLERFRTGELPVLIATDIAARGIDIDDVSHVVNFDLPSDPESYVHRVGRTARAGRTGTALSFCTADERSTLARIERLIGQRLRSLAGSSLGSARLA